MNLRIEGYPRADLHSVDKLITVEGITSEEFKKRYDVLRTNILFQVFSSFEDCIVKVS